MAAETETECFTKSCVCNVLTELVEAQIRLKKFLYCKYFRHMLTERKGEGLVPFMLYSKDEVDMPFKINILTVEGNDITDKISCIKTSFFGVESINRDTCCARIVLLRAVDFDGNETDKTEELFRLENTGNCIEIDAACFCAIQCLDPRLINRELPIIEPKW